MYKFTGETAWIAFPDPGFHRQPATDPVAQRDAEAIFNANTMVYTSQQNVKGAINDTLNSYPVIRSVGQNPKKNKIKKSVDLTSAYLAF